MQTTQLSRIESSAPMESQKIDGTLETIALVGCLSALLQFLNKAALKSGTFLLNGYWASFYSLSYRDGFRRRALIGSFFREFEPNGGNIIAVNILAGGVLVALLAIYITYFIRQSRRTTAWNYVFFAAFFLSALISIFFEVFGDLLQLALLLFLFAGWVLSRHIGSGALRVILALCIIAPCFLIHEAAIFFIAPCIPFLLRSIPRLKDFLISAVALVVFLAWSTLWSHVHPHVTYHLILLHGQKEIDTQEIMGTPSFGQLMYELYVVHFAGLRGKINLLIKIGKIFSLVFAGWVAVANIFPRRTLAKQSYLYVVLMVCSIPFWILAADWGRFSTYCFLLMVTLPFWSAASTEESDTTSYEEIPRFIESITLRLEWISQFTLVRITALIALVGSPFFAARIYGMNLRDLLCVLFVGVFAAAQAAGLIRDPLRMNESASS